MKQKEYIRKRARAERVYTWFLRLYPGAHRRTFAQQMFQSFQDHYRDVIETEGESELRFWLSVVSDEGKSLIKEHIAALRERKRALFIDLVVGLLLLVLDFTSGGPLLGGLLLSISLLGLGSPIYAALLIIIARFVRTIPRSEARPGWVRLGLVLGGIFSLYLVVLNVMSVLIPVPPDGGYDMQSIMLLSLPLVAGVVGLIGGYTSGTTRIGTFAGLLTGFIGLVVNQVSWLLMVVLLWGAIQHNLLQSSLEGDFHTWLQNSRQAPNLWQFLNWEIFEDGIGFPLTVGLIILTVEGLCATLGGALGAALKRTDDARHQVALPNPRPAGFILTMLVLSLLTWAGYAEFQSLGGQHRLLTLSDLSSSFTSPAGVSWLLGFLVVLAFVFVSARLNHARPEASAASR